MDIHEELVVWDSRFNLGIDAMDTQHKKLVEMCNDLFRGCLLGSDEANTYFKRVIKEAVAYVQTHFSDEEKILTYYKYPELTHHKQQHEEFVKEVLHQVAEFEKGASFVPNQFARFLRDWTLQHIAVEDQKYAKHILAVQTAQKG